MKNKHMCKRCVSDKTVRHIVFDKNGICNFCNSYDKHYNELHDYPRLNELFLKKLHTDKPHRYDVALGFSGGKDSTYVLYMLVKVYRLKVRAFTLDNGFLSGEAKEKIDRIVKEFGVEHEYVVCDDTILKDMYKYIVTKYLSPCIACSFLGYAAMINYASKIDAAVGIHGRSVPQMLRNYADDVDDFFKPFIESGLKEDGDDDKIFSTVLEKISGLVDKKLAEKIKENLLRDAIEKGFRPFLSYFLYHPYDAKNIISFLEEKTSWRVESEEEHFDCLIHHGALHIKNLAARRNHLMPEYSVMVREGTMSREEALQRLTVNDDIAASEKELKMLCDYADINYPLLMLKAKLYSKRWW